MHAIWIRLLVRWISFVWLFIVWLFEEFWFCGLLVVCALAWFGCMLIVVGFIVVLLGCLFLVVGRSCFSGVAY